MRPVPVDQFCEHVRQMHQDRDKGFEVEYQVRCAGRGAAGLAEVSC